MRSLRIFVLAVLVVLIVPENGKDSLRIVCYYSNWAQFRYGKAKFVPENIDPSLCTHLVYAFADLKFVPETEIVELRPFEWNDASTEDYKGMYERFQNVVHQYSNAETLLAVDGWNKYTGFLRTFFSSRIKREQFLKNATLFLRKYKFNGLVLHWNYPDGNEDRDDIKIFTQIVEDLKLLFVKEAVINKKPKLLLVLSVTGDIQTMVDREAEEIICRSADFLNVMAYDFHGPSDQVTGLFSPVFDENDIDNKAVNPIMKWWISVQCPREKLNLGIAFYGRSFTLTSNETGINAPATPGRRGMYTQTEGFLAHYEICEMKTKETKEIYLSDQKVVYMVQGNQWVGHENVRSVQIKVCYTKQYGFGGVMIWAVDLDDFNGEFCGKGKWPLLKAVKDQMEEKQRCLSVNRHTEKKDFKDKIFCIIKSDGNYVIPGSPNEYYMCNDGITYRMKCDPDKIFNPESRLCD